MLFRSALLIAGAGLAVAQSLSSNCTSAIIAVATSPDTTCLDLTLLAPIFLSNSSTTSVIPTFNTWLTGMCSQGACSNATLQAVSTNLTNGCASDLASIGITSMDNITLVETIYPPLRQIGCLKDTSANSLCVTELATDVQSATTTLSVAGIVNLVTQIMSGQNLTLPQNVTCSNCSKAAYTIVAQDFPSFQSDSQSAVQGECGSSFTNGQIPSNIQETASNSSSSSSSSSSGGVISLSASNLNVGLAMLIAVCSTFAILV